MSLPELFVRITTVTRHTLGDRSVKYTLVLADSTGRTKVTYGSGYADHRIASLSALKAAFGMIGGTGRTIRVEMRDAKGAAYPEIHAECLELSAKHKVTYRKVGAPAAKPAAPSAADVPPWEDLPAEAA